MPKKYSSYYKEDGTRVPSVTTVLSVIDKGPGLRNWLMKNGAKAQQMLDQSGKYGDLVHSIIEAHCTGQKVYPPDDIKPILDNFISLEERLVDKWLFHEKKVISEKYGYGGTTDSAFLSKEGKRVLLDIKTSNSVYEEYTYQLAAYREALKEMGEEFDEVMIFHLDKETKTWNTIYVDTELKKDKIRPFDVFLAALTIYKYKQ